MRLGEIHLKKGARYLFLSLMIIMGLISVIAIGGCNDSSSKTGTLSISLGDSVTDKVSEVWVTIEEVTVHESVDEENAGEDQNNGNSEGEDSASWKTIVSDGIPGTYNLLELVNGVFLELGEITLKAGHYTQIRLKLGGEAGDNYVVTTDEVPQEIDLQISSQDETGIKLTKGFDIEAGVVTELHLDWDVEKSIIEMPDDGYRMQPTIKIINVDVASTISGVVTEDDPNSEDPEVTIPVEGATVTAVNTDTNEEISTFSGDDGGYMLILEEGTYNIVISKEGYDDVISEGLEIGSEAADFVGEDFTIILTAS